MTLQVKALFAVLGLILAVPAFAEEGAPPKPADRFAQADTNGDGKVSRKEHLDAMRKTAEKMFERLDENKDGFITREEVAKIRDERRAMREEAAKKQAEGKTK